jgi:spermidine/putrescine transport system substrate-binding protein
VLVAAGWGSGNAAGMETITEEDLTASGLGTIEAPIFAQLPISIESRERHAATFEEIKAGF